MANRSLNGVATPRCPEKSAAVREVKADVGTSDRDRRAALSLGDTPARQTARKHVGRGDRNEEHAARREHRRHPGGEERAYEERRGQLTIRRDASSLLRHARFVQSVLEILLPQAAEAGSAVVLRRDRGSYQMPTCLRKAEIELVVLISYELFVEFADRLEHSPVPRTEGHGVDVFGRCFLDTKGGVTDTETRALVRSRSPRQWESRVRLRTCHRRTPRRSEAIPRYSGTRSRAESRSAHRRE